MDVRGENQPREVGSYIVLDGQQRNLLHHPTDFSVRGKCSVLKEQIAQGFNAEVQQLAIEISRVTVGEQQTEELMRLVRNDRKVAHHIYKLEDTREEIAITDRIFLRLQKEDANEIAAIVGEYKLDREAQWDNVYTLKVTSDSGRNPLKIANELTIREGVLSCLPEILLPIRFGSAPMPFQPALFRNEWHSSTDSVTDQPLDPNASLNVTRAWEIAGGMGKSEIVIAVIDDGFDLANPQESLAVHDAFKESVIDQEHMKNFGDGDPKNVLPRGKDAHGTCVASVIFATGDAMLGVAPGCTFLPIRTGSISNIEPDFLIKILKEVSEFADVVNCSFSMKPQSSCLIQHHPDLLPTIETLTKNGGRTGKGLIIVFSAGNDNAPISMSKEQNKNGITFVQNNQISDEIVTIQNLPVHCGFSELPGVVVVGAMTSIKRKADYSNWGEQITVVAPSDNFHELTMFRLHETVKAHRQHFPELGIVAALNRVDGDRPLLAEPLKDDPSTADSFENFYTKEFGGTSAAAALVSGVIGLMLSVNPNLTPQDVIRILEETAEHDNDKLNHDKLVDLQGEPNLTGLDGKFNSDHRSVFFGSGKVDAAAAVLAAK
jgi:subtilisin family serine protease